MQNEKDQFDFQVKKKLSLFLGIFLGWGFSNRLFQL
jgi:hypothetical protein